MRVTAEQVDIIRKAVDEGNITIETLRDDVVDHLCCTVEIMMERGKDFEPALKESLKELAPDGLQEIQEQTLFLLNSTKIIRMKKVMYSIGLLSSISVSIGFLMKLLHWPGADEIFVYGLFSFVLIFIPMLAVNHFKMNIRQAFSENLKIILGSLSALLFSAAITFKILHLQGADQLLIVSIVLFSFGFLPLLFFNMYKKSVS